MSKTLKTKKEKSKGSKSCPPGMIRRKGYERGPYEKQAHERTTPSGKTIDIKATHVGETHVPSTCVPAKGKAIYRGYKTPASERTLPQPSDKFHLRNYGYSTHKSDAERHKIIDTAINDLKKTEGDYAALDVEKHLLLISNFNPDPTAKETLRDDVKYISIKRAKDAEKKGIYVHSEYYPHSSAGLQRYPKGSMKGGSISLIDHPFF